MKKNREFIFCYTKTYKNQLVWGAMFAILSVFFVLLLPQITQLFIDSVYNYAGSESSKFSLFWFFLDGTFDTLPLGTVVLILCVMFLACAFLKNLTEWASTRNFFKVGSNSCGNLRNECFRKLAFIERNDGVNEAYYNFTSDINDMYDIVYKIKPKIFTLILTIIFSMIVTFLLSWEVGLVYVVFVPVMLWVGIIAGKKTGQIFNESRNCKSDMMTDAEELIFSAKEIKNFGNEDWAISRFDTSNMHQSITSQDSNKAIHKITFILNLIKAFGYVFVVAITAYSAFTGLISVGYFVLLIAYAAYVFNSTSSLVSNFYELKACDIGVEHLIQFMNIKGSEENSQNLSTLTPNIEFKDLSLQFGGHQILNKVNLSIPFGLSYAFIVPQGEGKTAMSKTLLRFLNIDSGQICFNEQSIENINVDILREQISFVSQEPYVFEDTIKNNIVMYDSEVDQDRLEKVATICGLTKTISKFPKKYNHKLTENGVGLSSQEKQLINIARALYKNAPVLLMDSPFVKFPPTTAKSLFVKILKFYKGKTVIYMTESVENANLCNEKIYFKKGKILKTSKGHGLPKKETKTMVKRTGGENE